MKVVLTVGLIASGKSTWAKQFVKDNPDYVRLSRDDFRFMIDNYAYTEATEKLVTTFMDNCISELVKQKKNIIIDEQHLNEKRRNERINYFKSKGYEVEIREFPITLSEAIKRDKERPFSIGESVIKKTWRSYELQLKDILERHKTVYPFNANLPDCILVDIDGTLSNSYQRRIFDFKACVNDIVIEPVKYILDCIRKANPNVTIILLSGRDSICRAETAEWILVNKIPCDFLYMRNEKDNRSDVIVKTELFNEFIRDKYQPLFVVDDRPVVLEEVWQKLGIFTLNVNQDAKNKNDF
jgi:predicted kinase